MSNFNGFDKVINDEDLSYNSNSFLDESDSDLNNKTQNKKSFKWITILICIGVFSILLRLFIFEPYFIPSSSMENTLLVGDNLIADKFFWKIDNNIKQRDIILFKNNKENNNTYIKRVIAIGGQTVDLKDGKVIVDGVYLDEPYLKPSSTTTELSGSNITFPFTVPNNQVFVMGDNRNNSKDSRFFGSIDKNQIYGKPLFIYYPFDRIRIF